jgi:hypothetical protein
VVVSVCDEIEVIVAELLNVVVEETKTPMQTYWSVPTPSEPALPSPKASKPPFQTQLWAKPGKGPKVEPPRPSALFAAPKHSVESATSVRPAEAQLRPASSRV